jgi:hypothetical protein
MQLRAHSNVEKPGVTERCEELKIRTAINASVVYTIVATMTVTTLGPAASNETGTGIETTTAILIGATDVVAQETGRDVSSGTHSRAYETVDNRHYFVTRP